MVPIRFLGLCFFLLNFFRVFFEWCVGSHLFGWAFCVDFSLFLVCFFLHFLGIYQPPCVGLFLLFWGVFLIY